MGNRASAPAVVTSPQGALAAAVSTADLDTLDGQPIPGEEPLRWRRADVVVEWGFDTATAGVAYDGSIESTHPLGIVGVPKPLPGDSATTMIGDYMWRSPAAGGARRGIVVALLYSSATRGATRTIITVRTSAGSFSFQPVDLATGPILAPEYGFFVAKAAANTTARAFAEELAAKNLKTVRQMVREHAEQTFEHAVRALHGDMELPPMPEPTIEPVMTVEVPDEYLTGLWRLGAWGIIRRCEKDERGATIVGDHPFPPLGAETDRILWALDQMGMHTVAEEGMANWLDNQQEDGCLSLDNWIEATHKIGALIILWAMTEHYRLTGDTEWLKAQAPRLKAAADWIINRRRTTMKAALSPKEAEGLKTGDWSPYGLQLKIASGDGDMGRYYYPNDAFAYQSVKLFADVIADVDPKLGAEYAAEAEAYCTNMLPVVNESIVLSPVIKVRDGTYRSFIPQGFQDRGPLSRALPEGSDVWSHCGIYHTDYGRTVTAIEAWVRSGVLSVDDRRVDGHFDVAEDVFLWDHIWFRKRKADYTPERDWFDFGWGYQSGWERFPEYYLWKDDVENFIRSWLNRCAVDLNFSANPERVWTFNEHTFHAENDKSHGRAVFLSNFRNMLVTEIGDELWLARATPRAWLEQGKTIAVGKAPTYFGSMGYEIVSDVDKGTITATIELPSRTAPKGVWLRLRHPKALPIKSVTVNGKPWKDFDADKEAIVLRGLTGKVTVTASY